MCTTKYPIGKKISLLFLAGIAHLNFAFAQPSADYKLQKEITGYLTKHLDSLLSPGLIITGNECLHSPENLKNYYLQSNYSAAWITSGSINPLCDSLIDLLKQSYLDGLNPNNYHLTLIKSLYDSLLFTYKKNPQESFHSIVALELLLTDSFITYTSDLYAGHIHTQNENIEWKEHMMEINPADSLKKAVESNDLKTIISNFTCPHQGYIKLKALLLKTIIHHGGWNALSANNNLKKDSDAQHVSQIILNMERWRWLPHIMNEPYIMVNIANFKLHLIDSDKSIMEMKIIVGKTYTQTPLFSAKMLYLVINPWWEIPPSIAKKEILPAIKKNKNYLVKNRIDVYENWESDAPKISPDSINWNLITSNNLTYRFRQEPGADNALGHIKFIFPNKFNVYLHDTPQRDLFLRNNRTFSHGCIRIEKPFQLAAYLLKTDSSWKKDSLTTMLNTAVNKTVLLPKPINVYICYWTAWIDKNGNPSFRPDIYQYDKRLLELMPENNFMPEQKL